MKTVACDILKANICREVMNLSKGQLEAVSTFIELLVKKEEKAEECKLPDELLQSAIDYTCRAIEKGESFYTTEEVFSKLDKEMEWK